MNVYYTDGSANPNPGPGGFAVIKNGQPYLLGKTKLETTNIKMEGNALLAALKDSNSETCEIYSDSEFWINVLTKWAKVWAKNNWQKKTGEIKNLDLVKELYQVYSGSKAELIWVRGHVGRELNEMADKWANIARTSSVKDNGSVIRIINQAEIKEISDQKEEK